MALGKAFIEVHADTKPFARELGRDLIRIMEAAEKDIRKSARNIGQTISTETGKGIEKESKKLSSSLNRTLKKAVDQDDGIFKRFAKGIVDSIDDGLSGLPAEVKIALGAAVAAMLPFIGAAVTGLVSATVVAAFAGLGVLIGSQFAVVQNRFDQLVLGLQDIFLGNGSIFVEPLLAAMDLVQTRLDDMEGQFREVFAVSAGFIEPVTNALINFIQGLLPGLINTLRNTQSILYDLQVGFFKLGQAIGNSLELISGSDYANEGLRDLLTIVAALISGFAVFVRALTEVYGWLRQIALIASGPKGVAQIVAEVASDKQAEMVRKSAAANGDWADSFYELATATEAQAAAVKGLNAQLQEYERMVLGQINNEIAWEQAIDDFTESVKENGRSLKVTEQAGRDNANALLALAQQALKTRTDNINMGMSVIEAQKAFDKQKASIYALAAQMKLSKADTDKLVGALLNIPPPVSTGVTADSIARLQRVLTLLQAIASAPGFGAIFGAVGKFLNNKSIPAYADGGIVDSPRIGLVGEAGPEAIIPLNKPARAAQVMSQAGLGAMMSPTVNVYIGNQLLQTYVDERVDSRNQITARSLAYGGRGF